MVLLWRWNEGRGRAIQGRISHSLNSGQWFHRLGLVVFAPASSPRARVVFWGRRHLPALASSCRAIQPARSQCCRKKKPPRSLAGRTSGARRRRVIILGRGHAREVGSPVIPPERGHRVGTVVSVRGRGSQVAPPGRGRCRGVVPPGRDRRGGALAPAVARRGYLRGSAATEVPYLLGVAAAEAINVKRKRGSYRGAVPPGQVNSPGRIQGRGAISWVLPRLVGHPRWGCRTSETARRKSRCGPSGRDIFLK